MERESPATAYRTLIEHIRNAHLIEGSHNNCPTCQQAVDDNAALVELQRFRREGKVPEDSL